MSTFKRKKAYKFISLALIAVMLFTLAPWSARKASAFDPDNFYVTNVTIGKTFDAGQIQNSMYITIEGRNIQNASVQVFVSGQPRLLTNPKINTNDTLYFEFSNPSDWEALKGITKITVGGASINIGDKGSMPALNGINPRTVMKDTGSVTIYGSDFNLIGSSGEFSVTYGRGITFTKVDNSLFTSDNSVTLNNLTGELGLQDIVIERRWQTEDIFFNSSHTNKVIVDIFYKYTDQFRLVQNLDISEDLQMFPNRGSAGSRIYFKADTLNLYDVFFLKKIDGTDPYTTANRGKNPTYKYNAEGEKDILTVEVPNLEKGEYYVVITNKVPDGADPMSYVSGERVLDQKFTVIDGYRSAGIDTIQPSIGPDTGSPAVISGRYLGSLNIDDLAMEPDVIVTDFIYNEQQDHPFLLRTWQKNGQKVASYNGRDITEITKKITVIIGNMATFRNDSSFSPEIDKLSILVSPITIDDGNYVRDVVVETETTLKYDTGRFVFTERAELPQAYTFIPSTLKPEVSSVVPEEIFLEKDQDGKYRIGQDLLIAISGKNFLINKYNDEVEGFVTRYPIIQFSNAANKVVLDKNTDPDLRVYVEDSSGNILDGTAGNEIGTRIVAVIPKGTEVPEAFANTAIPAIVTNPIRNSSKPGLSSDDSVTVKFLLPNENKIPVIESVNPDVVTVDGGETITIKGSNFQDGVKVLIDGREVSGITRAGDGRTITFKAPAGREGSTQLAVINPGGGMAVRDFYYVKTYTDPKITDFAPKSGNTGTLVQVKGDNFLAPDPTAKTDEIYKLIGTRILLEGQDINQYNIDPETKSIRLRDYVSPEEDKIIDIGQRPDGGEYVKVADYWHSVVLYDEQNDKFYVISLDPQGNPVISDGVNNTYKVTVKDGKLYADKTGGTSFPLTLQQSDGATQIVIGSEASPEVRLILKTPFKVDANGKIVGDAVKVVDKNTIIFKVPILTLGDGWYDLTVLNPDTKRDSRMNEQGFYYYTQPQSKPAITQIVPDKGSTDGGYTVDIIGSDFKDDGINKTRVFINGVEIGKEDTFVSVDGSRITVKVPPFSGDLSKEKGTDRVTVPVVVINPDGASAGKEDGFTYVVPTSHPQITRIMPQKGSAAGQEVVEIFGRDFRFFEPFSDDNRNQTRDENELYQDISGNGQWDDFRGKTVEELKQNMDKYGNNALLVLPKVYFGNRQAQVLEFSDGYIKVLTPPSAAGDADVYVVNNDSGISNMVKFAYQSSNPAITGIVPAEGNKQGGDRVEIFGTGFVKSSINVYSGQTPPEVLVRFGNITNRDIPREQENSGRIDNQRTTVYLAGGLKVEYASGQVMLEISEKGLTYTSGPINYDGSVMFFPTDKLVTHSGTGDIYYKGGELVRLEIADRRLFVERGYAAGVEYVDSGHLVVTTPAYYTIGRVDVTVINPDGGTAKGQFEYKNPASSPVIINITKEGNSPQEENINGRDVKVLYMTYKGGNTVSIIGSDFRENARIQISDIATLEPGDITYTLPSKLTFTMPAVPESAVGKLHRVIVINEDGGIASSDECTPKPIYIMFVKGETAPAVKKVTPDHGPATGGTTVKIEGSDFREGLKVFFGEVTVPQENVRVVDYKTIIVTTPPHPPGKVEVRVENPDGELSTAGSFTYLSSPRISAVVDPADPAEATRITRISVEGGQEIKLKGSGFEEGARVFFNPSIKKVEDESNASGTIIYIDGIPYVLESGTEGTDVKFIDSETLTVKTPPGKLGTGGVMVINPDGGATDIYRDLTYELTQLTAPLEVHAELVYDRYIKINWNSVDGASEYEVYAVIDDNDIEFIGSTDLNSYMYSDLEANTRYKFIVKALGKFGSSPPSAESNTVRTGRTAGPVDEDGSIDEKTQKQIVGDTQNVSIGLDDYKTETRIDLTSQDFAGVQKAVVSIPAQVITKKDAADIIISGKDFVIKFNPAAFNTSKIYQYRTRNDAGVRFSVAPYKGSTDAKGRILLSQQYVLKADFYLGADSTSMEYLNSSMQITLEYDIARAGLRKLNSIALCRYDEYGDTWQEIAKSAGGAAVSALVDSLGRFAVMGSGR